MAGKKKKYKNVKLEQTELMPTAIGSFDSKRKSFIGTVLILGIFILTVVFLPEISDYVNDYLNPKGPTISNNPENPNKQPALPTDPENKDNFTEFVNNLRVTNDDIIVSNFVLDPLNSTISYDITNNLGNAQDIEELNYYLEIFNTEQTMLERVKLADQYTLNSGAFINIKRKISVESATTIGYISIVKKTVNDYPLFELNNSVDGNGSMVCSNTNEKVTYKFRDNKLKEVISEASYLKTELDYLTLFEQNQIKVNTYNNQIGITSTLFEHSEGYNITTTINLSESDRTYLFNADSFKLDTEPKVVKFEMEAQGFKCE